MQRKKPLKEYTHEEIKKHNQRNDLWIIIDDLVYDVSNYLDRHPGGEIILNYAGQDCSSIFLAYHPQYVRDTKLPYMCIGQVKDPVPKKKIDQEYRQLHDKLEKEGIFETNWVWQVWKLTYPFLFLIASLTLLFYPIYNQSFDSTQNQNTISLFMLYGRMILSGLALGLFQHQCAFIGHDTLHTSITKNFDIDYLIGLFYGNLCFGVSSLWWKYTHNQHHVVPNEWDRDPDITHLPVFAVNKNMFLKYNHKKGAYQLNWLGKFLITNQYILYFPILIIGARFSMYWQCIYMLFVLQFVPTMPWQKLHFPSLYLSLERITLILYYIWYTSLIVLGVPYAFDYYQIQPSLSQNDIAFHRLMSSAVFFIVAHLVVGFLHAQLTLSHWERPSYHSDEGDELSWFEKQVVTGRNIEGNIFNEWFYGGLHFQVEHHLFPRCPRSNLRQVQPYVMDICKRYNVPYSTGGFWSCLFDVVHSLYDVSYFAQS